MKAIPFYLVGFLYFVIKKDGIVIKGFVVFKG